MELGDAANTVFSPSVRLIELMISNMILWSVSRDFHMLPHLCILIHRLAGIKGQFRAACVFRFWLIVIVLVIRSEVYIVDRN